MTSDPEWNHLADAWRDEPATTEAFDLTRMRARLKRRALVARFKAAADVILCLAVAGIAISAIAKGTAAGVIMGLGGLAFVLFGLTVAFWVARAPWETRAGTVDAALKSEIVQTRSAIRRARSGYYMSAGAIVFIILTAITLHPSLGRARSDDTIFAIGLSLLTIVGAVAWGAWMDRRLSRKLVRLEKILAELTAEED
ncbi:hypothetical protein [Caulobacter sp. NIBR2454]|uniref:hypothetical protein n=1 Tax=Caulobacter sp. NIBR2454 TaxID=3015996 RepID=UPI0022B66790|nr:hypothetical protein [Caulobacter sp. NIBR2454]